MMVFPMLKTILYDPNEYSNPEEFNPGHFLDEDGKFMKRDKCIPFSIGTLTSFSQIIMNLNCNEMG